MQTDRFNLIGLLYFIYIFVKTLKLANKKTMRMHGFFYLPLSFAGRIPMDILFIVLISGLRFPIKPTNSAVS